MEVSLSSISCKLDYQQGNPVKCTIGQAFLQRYEVLNSVGEGTYGLVLRCQVYWNACGYDKVQRVQG